MNKKTAEQYYTEIYANNIDDDDTSFQIEISDEDIENGFISYYGKRTQTKFSIWDRAIYWYREKIKKKQ